MITVYYLENKCDCGNPMQISLTSEYDWQPECMVCLKKHSKTFEDLAQATKQGFVLRKFNSPGVNGAK